MQKGAHKVSIADLPLPEGEKSDEGFAPSKFICRP